MIRTYSEMCELDTFEERFEYLALSSRVGKETFGFERYLNQNFYRSREWKRIRDHVLTRDEGCDLGIPGRDISIRAIVHHMNPMDPESVATRHRDILDPEFLITVSHKTHNAIHYGDASILVKDFIPRSKGDTQLW